MTCIIGLKTAAGVWIGGDSHCQYPSSVGYKHREKKVFHCNQFLIGAAGSIRAKQILKHHLRVIEQYKTEVDDIEHYLVVYFAESIRSKYRELGFSQVENAVERGSQFILGYRGQLFVCDSDFTVNAWMSDFVSIGSGQEVAMGAMAALTEIEPKKRILRALEISAEYISSVGAPFYVEFLKSEGD